MSYSILRLNQASISIYRDTLQTSQEAVLCFRISV